MPSTEGHPTERQALKDSEQRFRLLVESVRDYAIFMLDPEGRVISWNAGAERLKGWKASEIIGRHFETFYPDEDRKRQKPQLELKAAAAVGRFEDEGWRLRKDGSRFWANVVITRLIDEHGVLVGYAKVTRDMTEQRRAVESLRQSEQRSRALIDSVRDYAIFMLDAAGRVITWNTGAQRIKGYRPEEIIGQHFSKFYPAEDVARDKPGAELRAAEENGRVEDEGWRLRKDGSRFWANVVISAVRDEAGRLIGFAKVTRDLSERRRMEEALRESEERYRTLVQVAPDGILMATDGRVSLVNDALVRLVGPTTAAELAGRPLTDFILADDRAVFDSRMLQLESLAKPVQLEVRMLRVDGSMFFAEVSAIRVDNRAARNLQLVVRDVSERKRAEESLRRALEDLRRSNKELDDYASFASHDLQEPLRKISAYADLLDRRYKGKLDGSADTYLRYLVDAAMRMQALVRDLLTYSRIGRMGERPMEQVDLGLVIQDVLSDLEVAVKESGAALEVGRLPTVGGSRPWLTLVLQNLVSNALKYRHPERKPVVKVSGRLADDGWVITVADNGIGIEPVYHARIFEPFRRLHSKDEYPGTGIGLAVAKKVVELYGGRIWVDSEAGKGAAFSFLIPEPGTGASRS